MSGKRCAEDSIESKDVVAGRELKVLRERGCGEWNEGQGFLHILMLEKGMKKAKRKR